MKKKIKKKYFKPYPESKLCDNSSTYNYDEVWGTLDGQRIPIVNLRNSHIENIIEHLTKQGRLDSLKIILAEKRRRRRRKLLKTKLGKLLYECK